MMKLLPWFSSIAMLFFLAEPVFAEGSIRCEGHIIDAGAPEAPTMDEVLEKCGEPDERRGNTWVYKQAGSLNRLLHFEPNGQLSRIDTE